MRKRSPKTDGAAYGELASTFNLKYHQEQRFIMSCGDQIAEFSHLKCNLLKTASSAVQASSDELPQDRRTISITPLTHLLMNVNIKRKREVNIR